MTDYTEMAEIAHSGLFDGAFYASQLHREAAADSGGLRHFCDTGWKNGLRPNAFFDTPAYLREHADVAGSDLNPLLHYIRHGEQEGRRPVSAFDPVWYHATYHPPRLALSHYLRRSDARLVLPTPEAFALAFTKGLPAREAPPSPDALCEFECQLVRESGLVDPDYYLINGEDVYDAGIEPSRHFSIWGWREHRRPNICFDTDWYLMTNPEVRRLGINPLAHYILIGEHIGRRPVPWFDPLWYRQRYEVPGSMPALRHYLGHRRTRTVSPSPLFDVDWFVDRYSARVGDSRDPFAYYLQQSVHDDIAPSPTFDTIAYRHAHMGRPSKYFMAQSQSHASNPLIHKCLREYLERG